MLGIGLIPNCSEKENAEGNLGFRICYLHRYMQLSTPIHTNGRLHQRLYHPSIPHAAVRLLEMTLLTANGNAERFSDENAA